MARPVKSDSEKLHHMLGFRLTDADFLVWQKKVSDSGYSAGEFFRLAVITNKTIVQGVPRPAIQRRPPTDKVSRKELFLLAQTSNNINQIARQVNTAHLAGKVTRHLYFSVLTTLQEISIEVKGRE